jgi:hypothetical protein
MDIYMAAGAINRDAIIWQRTLKAAKSNDSIVTSDAILQIIGNVTRERRSPSGD